MRPKEPKIVLTFRSTTDAVAAEDYFMEKEIPGRIIPVPRDISASCGLAWCGSVETAGDIEHAKLLGRVRIEGTFNLML